MMRLSEAAAAVGGKVLGNDVDFRCVVSDSRAIQGGELFVALRGERFDGHDFVADCLRQGAAAAMVARQVADAGPQLLVADTRLALGQLAAYWRDRFSGPLAAVTGSNGKTTVKEMLAAVLRAAAGDEAAVLATQGNLNNDIGLPLTLLKLHAAHRYAVLEMGMNHPGEIAYLTRIARPDVALINNAQPAHLQGLGSVEAVARAKGEIFEGLAADGVAVINADDAHAGLWRGLAGGRPILTFGLDHPAEVSASCRLRPDGSDIALRTPAGEATLALPLPGLHNVRNALAATAAASALQVPLEAIVRGLSSFGGVRGRLQRKPGLRGALVIDDTYNANPASMRAAIDVLAACAGTRILVLGDMGELGEQAVQQHAEIGAAAKAAGIEALYCLGELSRGMAAAYGTGAQHFADAEELLEAVRPQLREGVAVLVKGSRFMHMERVVQGLVQDNEEGAKHAA